MGTIYAKGERIYFGHKNAHGKWVYGPTPYRVGQEDLARAFVVAVERGVATGARGEAAGAEPPRRGPLTLKEYAEGWLRGRPALGIATATDEACRLRRYVYPALGALPLAELRPRHVRDLVRSLPSELSARRRPLAPRTVRHVYGVLHRLLADAVADELIPANPCVVKRTELPRKIDADPAWRAGAVFTRGEVEALISDPRIPLDRRAVYAVLALAGPRFGEAAALRWRSYEATAEPLGRLSLTASFDAKAHAETSLKTERPRTVPVHPTLAKVLAEWRLSGWATVHPEGRPPRGEDLILPSRQGENRNVNLALKRFHGDCERLGLRRRRLHDLRRTFISLCLGDGARKDVLRWVTHGPTGDIVDLYTTLPWEALCGEVAKLRVGLLEGREVAMRRVVGGADGGDAGTPDPRNPISPPNRGSAAEPLTPRNQARSPAPLGCLTTGLTTAGGPATKSPASSVACGASLQRGGRDSNPRPSA